MITRAVERREWAPADRMTFAPLTPEGLTVRAPAVLTHEGEPVALMADWSHHHRWLDGIAAAIARVEWQGETGSESRLSGWNNRNRTFGTSTPVPLRRRYGCAAATFTHDYPELASELTRVAEEAAATFRAELPQVAARHDELVAPIHPDWLLGTAPWTSGIINATSVLPYHRDAGNLKGSWSAMLTLRRRATGGHLHLPEFDALAATTNYSLTLFDGQGVWHGVTPIGQLGPDAYRYTIVLYAKRDACRCGPAAQESARAAALRMAAEERMAGIGTPEADALEPQR